MNEEPRYRLVDQSCVDEIFRCFSSPEESEKFLREIRDFAGLVHRIHSQAFFNMSTVNAQEAVLGVVFGFLDIVYCNMDMIQDMVRKLKFVECSKEELPGLLGISEQEMDRTLAINHFSKILNYLKLRVSEKEEKENQEEEEEEEEDGEE